MFKKWYHVVPGALSQTQCADLCSYANTHKAQDGTVGVGGTPNVNQNIRTSTVRWLKRSDPLLQELYDVIDTETKFANSKFWGLAIEGFTSVQFTEYSSLVQAHYDWHQDNAWIPTKAECWLPTDRKLSVCIQLTPKESYVGGEFWVNPAQKEEVKDFKNVGDIIIFPSLLWHKVEPVTSGCRNSLVTWWDGPPWR